MNIPHRDHHPLQKRAAHLRRRCALIATLTTAMLLGACASDPAPTRGNDLSPRLQALFAKTKRVCMGRYAMEVPTEAYVAWGDTAFPRSILTVDGDAAEMKAMIDRVIAQVLKSDPGAEIVSSRPGPVAGSWQLRLYRFGRDKAAKYLQTRTYVQRGVSIFSMGWNAKDTDDSVLATQAYFAEHLRPRDLFEVPDGPGFCIRGGFIADDRYASGEMIDSQLIIPSLGVVLDITSSQDAFASYGDKFEAYKEEMRALRAERNATRPQGTRYEPHPTVLREGWRDVQHWHGEERLIKYPDGARHFEWVYHGKLNSVAEPPSFNLQMRSPPSMTDAETMALWDRLLPGLKFRVKVPGAPEGSYYTGPATP